MRCGDGVGSQRVKGRDKEKKPFHRAYHDITEKAWPLVAALTLVAVV